MVDKAATTHVRQLYIDPDHVVFDLVPGPLNAHLKECYNELGRPAVTRQTVWAVYLDLLHVVQDHAARLPPLPTAAMIEQTDSVRSLLLRFHRFHVPAAAERPAHSVSPFYSEAAVCPSTLTLVSFFL